MPPESGRLTISEPLERPTKANALSSKTAPFLNNELVHNIPHLPPNRSSLSTRQTLPASAASPPNNAQSLEYPDQQNAILGLPTDYRHSLRFLCTCQGCFGTERVQSVQVRVTPIMADLLNSVTRRAVGDPVARLACPGTRKRRPISDG